jgi:hypothetical protein
MTKVMGLKTSLNIALVPNGHQVMVKEVRFGKEVVGRICG